MEIPDDIEDSFEILWGQYREKINESENAALQKQFTPDDPPIIKVIFNVKFPYELLLLVT